MSITFAPMTSGRRPVVPCTCDPAWSEDLEFPCEGCRLAVNLSNSNAYDLLRWLELTPDACGEVCARELAARCRRRLWDEVRNHDPAVSASDQRKQLGGGGRSGARLFTFGRDAGYLRDRTTQLLEIAEAAGDGWVTWA